MRRRDMNLLDQRRVVARRGEHMVTQWQHRGGAGRGAGEADGGDADLARGAQRGEHVRRLTRGRDGDEQVATAAEAAQLALEYLVVAVIVADRSEYRGVGGERDCGERMTVEAQPREKLACDVLRVSRAAAV